MKKYITCLLFLAVILLGGCKEEQKQLTLPEEKLISLLYDIQVAEAALKGIHSMDKDSVSVIYYQEIYDRHEVSEAVLKENLNILKDNPKLTNKIFKEVLVVHKKWEKKRDKDGKPKK